MQYGGVTLGLRGGIALLPLARVHVLDLVCIGRYLFKYQGDLQVAFFV